MPEANITNRLDSLEEQVRQILAHLRAPNGEGSQPRDWRQSLGMFDGRAMMKQVDEEGRQIRQRDREQVVNDNS